MAIAYLMLGSNLGNKLNNLQLATETIRKQTGSVLKSSAIYESEPWGFTHHENFYNQLHIIITSLNPEGLLKNLLEIEMSMGRVRNKTEYQARTIDIDIIFYENLVIQSDDLIIPHPRIADRKFVLLPLIELDPGLLHPVSMKTCWQMYRECKDKLSVNRKNQ